jgi:hypothetical protein
MDLFSKNKNLFNLKKARKDKTTESQTRISTNFGPLMTENLFLSRIDFSKKKFLNKDQKKSLKKIGFIGKNKRFTKQIFFLKKNFF